MLSFGSGGWEFEVVSWNRGNPLASAAATAKSTPLAPIPSLVLSSTLYQYMPWWSGTSSDSLMAAKVGGMALWRRAARCAEMDSRRRR